jgi:hypothetical protein
VSLEGISGVDPATEPSVVDHGEVSAVVSAVRLEEFGAEPLKRNLEDLAWLERVARAHDSVLARAMSAASVLPLRLCTIFTDESHVRDMLAERLDYLRDALAYLDGHAEWSVKLLADRRRVEDLLREPVGAVAEPRGSGHAEPRGSGHAYFARKRADRLVRDRARAIAEAAALETHECLSGHARAATVLPPQHPELSGRSGEMVLNGAYLVSRAEYEKFVAAAEGLRARRHGEGLELELSGPWAPYNFVPGRREAE